MSMNNFTIISDMTCDMPEDYLKENDVNVIPLLYTIDSVEYNGTPEHSLDIHEFYEKLKKGYMAKTAQITPEKATQFFENELKKGKDVLYIAFSSGLSGSYQSSIIAQSELAGKYENKLVCIDSLCASLGEGLLLDYAVQKRKEGLTFEETVKAVEEVKLKLCHYFTVDDLNHLYRGGRVSKTAALFGTMLGIKPVMHVNEEGKLIPIGKVRGRRQSLDSLVNKMETKLSEYKNPYVFISHGDCIDDAKYVSEQVKKRFGIKTKVINTIGPVIGTHSGPGTVALFFIGSGRAENRI